MPTYHSGCKRSTITRTLPLKSRAPISRARIGRRLRPASVRAAKARASLCIRPPAMALFRSGDADAVLVPGDGFAQRRGRARGVVVALIAQAPAHRGGELAAHDQAVRVDVAELEPWLAPDDLTPVAQRAEHAQARCGGLARHGADGAQGLGARDVVVLAEPHPLAAGDGGAIGTLRMTVAVLAAVIVQVAVARLRACGSDMVVCLLELRAATAERIADDQD